MSGLYKALVFGLVVMWVCCYKGYHAQRMATGVKSRHDRSSSALERADTGLGLFPHVHSPIEFAL